MGTVNATEVIRPRWATKEQLIQALKSGDYRKTKGTLYRDTTDPTNEYSEGYCCLGVLCHISGVPRDNLKPYSFIRQVGSDDDDYSALESSSKVHVGDGPEWLTYDAEFQLATLNDRESNWSAVIDYLKGVPVADPS